MLNDNYEDQEKYFPMLVETSFIDYQKLRSLPKKIQGILLSEKIVDFIYGASQRYNLDDVKTEEFSRTVRQYFFNEIVDGQFARKIAELCNTSNEEGLEILNSIKNIQLERESVTKRNLITGQSYSAPKSASVINFSSNISAASQRPVGGRLSSATPSVSNIVQVPIKKALKLYPKLENLNLTESQIVSKPFLKPVKPTIKNWLTVYEELMGIGKKGAIDRGNFLFHSEAAKNLPTEDRQKLAQVLKSADENSNLKIDTIKGVIIFSEISSGDNKVSNNSSSIEKEYKNNAVSAQFKENIYTNKSEKINQTQQLNTNEPSNYQLNHNEAQLGLSASSQNFVPSRKSSNQAGTSNVFQETKNITKQNIQSPTPIENSQNGDLYKDQLKTNLNSGSINKFEPELPNENFQDGSESFVSGQNSINLNNFSSNLENGKFGTGMGSDNFKSTEQETISLNDLNNSNEENIEFTSRHVLPTENK